MQARFYLPQYGRFASPDPARDQHFEDTQSWNIYSYCRNNPVMDTDPDGKKVYSGARDLKGSPIGNHGFLVLVPDRPKDFENSRWKDRMIDLGGGVRGITLGGFEGTGAQAGKLVAMQNNTADVASVKEVNNNSTVFYKNDADFSAKQIKTPDGKTDSEFISGLLSSAEQYNGNPVNYKLFPSGGDNGNCLSLEAFLLKGNGVPSGEVKKALDHPGLDVGADKVIKPKLQEDSPLEERVK